MSEIGRVAYFETLRVGSSDYYVTLTRDTEEIELAWDGEVFKSYDKAVARAIEVVKEMEDYCDLLIAGDPVIAQPQQVIYASPHFRKHMVEMNQCWGRFEDDLDANGWGLKGYAKSKETDLSYLDGEQRWHELFNQITMRKYEVLVEVTGVLRAFKVGTEYHIQHWHEGEWQTVKSYIDEYIMTDPAFIYAAVVNARLQMDTLLHGK